MIQKFEFRETKISGLIEIVPFCAGDIRGCFTKDYSQEIFEANGIHYDLKEGGSGAAFSEGKAAT